MVRLEASLLKNTHFLFIVFFLLTCQIHAQVPNKYFKKWSVDGFGGVTMHSSDISSELAQAYGANLRYSFGGFLGLQAHYAMGKLKGKNPFVPGRLVNDFDHFGGRLVFNIGSLTKIKLGSKSGLNPYLFAGAGLIRNQVALPGLVEGRAVNYLRSSHTIYNGGAGLKIYLSKQVDLMLEYNYIMAQGPEIDGYINKGDDNSYMLPVIGFTFKPGYRNREHIDWKYLDKTPVPVEEKLPVIDSPVVVEDTPVTIIYMDTVSVDTVATDTVPPEPEIVEADSNTYYIIGGSFKILENAERRKKMLETNGHKAFIIRNKQTGLHRVVYLKLKDEKEANRRLEEVKKKGITDAWILVE